VSLLTSAGNTTLDQSGTATSGAYYVTTDSNGNFSITGDYMCAAGQQVYLYALGGNAGAGANAAAGLMAVLGDCPGGNFLAGTSPIPYVVVNEVSTVAAAYAIAGFATDALHVGSSGTALALTGIANAFANAGNLATLSTGVALATTPAGNGAVPQAEINTLANILAACVNSSGPVNATPCLTLFTSALAGGTTGAQPGDTATAAIDIAHNPAANVAALYGLSTANPPFGAALKSQPNDFTIALNFTGGAMNSPAGLGVDSEGNVWVASYFNTATAFSPLGKPLLPQGISGAGLSASYGLAVDANNNAWIPNEPSLSVAGNSVSVVNESGQSVAGSGGYTGGGLDYPIAVAIDTDTSVWVVDYGDSHLTHLSSSGQALSGTSGYTSGALAFPVAAAIDSSHNVWVANQSASTVTRVSPDGSQFTNFSCCDGPSGVAIDQLGNVWVANYYGNSISEISSAGTVVASGAYTSGGLDHPQGIAIDGAGNVWIANFRSPSIAELAGATAAIPGAALSPATGLGTDAALLEAYAIAIDPSGNLWVTNFGSNTLTQFIGAAAPVKTPLIGPPATP
jgi:streptogramin lyase